MATILKGIDGLIDAIGGLKGVIPGIIAAVTVLFQDKLVAGIDGVRQRIKVLTGEAEKEANILAEQTQASLDLFKSGSLQDYSQDKTIDNLKLQVNLNNELRKIKNDLTEEEMQLYGMLIKQTEEYTKQAIAAKDAYAQANIHKTDAIRNIKNKMIDSNGNAADKIYVKEYLLGNHAQDINKEIGALSSKSVDFEESVDRIVERLHNLSGGLDITAKDWREYVLALVEVKETLGNLNNAEKQEEIYTEAVTQAVTQHKSVFEVLPGIYQKYIDEIEAKNEKTEEEIALLEQLKEAQQKANDAAKDVKPFDKELTPSDKIVKGAQAVSQLTMAFTSLVSIIDVIRDDSIPVQDKFVRILTSLTMVIPMVISGIVSLNTAITGTELGFAASAAAMAPVLIGFAAVAAAAWLVYQAVNADAIALDKAKKAAEEAKDKYEKLNSEFKELESTLNNISEAQTSLESLKQGTEE